MFLMKPRLAETRRGRKEGKKKDRGDRAGEMFVDDEEINGCMTD